MEIHPAFDVTTKTWFVGSIEAPTIRDLIEKVRRRYKQPVKVKDYFPNGSPLIRYPAGDESFSRPTTPSLVAPPQHPGSRAGRGAEDLTPQERKQAIEDVLNLWSGPESLTTNQIAARLNLKKNYVGSNIIHNARVAGDPRAIVRNRKTFGMTKEMRAPKGLPKHAVDGDA